MRVPEGEEKDEGAESYPNLGIEMGIQIHEAQRS